jgi:heme exporter protein A
LGDGTISNVHKSTQVLTAKDLACRRGSEWLFTNLSFTIHGGQVIWLKGQNGRGKTSLMRLLVGLSVPDAGSIDWARSVKNTPTNKSADMVYIGHSNSLKEGLTVTESLQFLGQLHGRDCSNQRLMAALERLGINHRRSALVRTLSQGQRRRVALARLALETEPTLWVLDEPFDALDAVGTVEVNTLITEHTERGGSIFLTSHIPLSLDPSLVTTLDLGGDRVE